nr:hypothetical protein Iba_chr13dCG5080 [Ipomoea batatas]
MLGEMVRSLEETPVAESSGDGGAWGELKRRSTRPSFDNIAPHTSQPHDLVGLLWMKLSSHNELPEFQPCFTALLFYFLSFCFQVNTVDKNLWLFSNWIDDLKNNGPLLEHQQLQFPLSTHLLSQLPYRELSLFRLCSFSATTDRKLPTPQPGTSSEHFQPSDLPWGYSIPPPPSDKTKSQNFTPRALRTAFTFTPKKYQIAVAVKEKAALSRSLRRDSRTRMGVFGRRWQFWEVDTGGMLGEMVSLWRRRQWQSLPAMASAKTWAALRYKRVQQIDNNRLLNILNPHDLVGLLWMKLSSHNELQSSAMFFYSFVSYFLSFCFKC